MMFLRNVCAAHFVHKIYFIANILGNYLSWLFRDWLTLTLQMRKTRQRDKFNLN